MDDEIIVENMKAVLKSTKKKKAATNHNKNRGENSKDDELISDLMSKNWQMKSPNNDNKIVTNAFEKLMKKAARKSDSPSTNQKSDKSPTIPNGNGKKKKRHQRSIKIKKINNSEKYETESEKSVLDEDSLHDTSFFFQSKSRKAKPSPPSTDEQHSMPLEQIAIANEESARKRNRASEQQLEKPTKRRKTREVLLDSNENSLPSPVKEDEEEAKNTRPKRSCSNRIDYSLLLESPEKEAPVKSRRKATLKSKYEDDSYETVEIDENSPVKKQPKAKNPIKLAPLFIKKLPLDPSIVEARRNFLLSELPSNLRAPIEKQRKFEEEFLSNNLVAYPTIAHVRQQSDFYYIDFNEGKKLYSDSKISINDDDDDEEEPQKMLMRSGTICDYKTSNVESTTKTRELVEDIKSFVRAIKDKCENFATNRCFKQILQKIKTARNNDSGVESAIVGLSYQHSLFIDIFKPLSCDEFLIGVEPIKRLQEFLTTWNERNFRNDYYDSDDDESNSRHSVAAARGLNNFVVLSGKHGSGKSSSVYALANDLNYEVIEINAGSKRNGKKILQDLLEATQSHRVEKHLVEDDDSQSEGLSGNNGGSNGNDADKRTIILIEDAELTFENDDGFISSIQQLITISKRPVILTTNDRSCQHLQKFLQYNEIIYDIPKSYVTEYLSLISLATSNYKIDEAEIECLYARNSCDLRKTINEIEFFIRSDSASVNGGSLMGLYGNNTRNPMSESKRHRKGQLGFYGKQQHQQKGKNLSKLRYESSIISSQCTSLMSSWSSSRCGDDEISYHQHNFMNEMASYFEQSNVLQMEYEHDFAQRQQRIISRSISNEINTGNVSTRVKALEFAPMLRDMCRTERKRETTRRSSRNHYLKHFMFNNANLNEYFDEQSKIFEPDS